MHSSILDPAIERVRTALGEQGVEVRIQTLTANTRTAAEAAAALDCQVAQIAKTIIFEAVSSGAVIMVIASGANRICEVHLFDEVGEEIRKASAKFVLSKTGFVIGGVAPIGSINPTTTYFDSYLLQFDIVWAAAGTGKSVFSVSPQELLRITGAKVLNL